MWAHLPCRREMFGAGYSCGDFFPKNSTRLCTARFAVGARCKRLTRLDFQRFLHYYPVYYIIRTQLLFTVYVSVKSFYYIKQFKKKCIDYNTVLYSVTITYYQLFQWYNVELTEFFLKNQHFSHWWNKSVYSYIN